jgi:beta-glucanase (GH16 family)
MFLDIDKFPNVKPYYEMPITGNSLPNETSRYFRKPFYIIFNLAVGGTFSEIYDINKITAFNHGDAKMYVDYVRVYQKKKR